MTGMILAHQPVRGRRKVKIGGAREDRTPDLVNAIQVVRRGAIPCSKPLFNYI